MTRRVRKPTARALDAAQSRLLEQAARERPPPAAPSLSANSAAVKRKGRAVNAKGRTAVAQDQARASAQATEEEQDQEDADSEQQDRDGEAPDLTLYCVCLGYDTGEQPMIQCEHCTNWSVAVVFTFENVVHKIEDRRPCLPFRFHFDCIGIDESFAAQIEGYACEMCQQMGVGTTRSEFSFPIVHLLLPRRRWPCEGAIVWIHRKLAKDRSLETGKARRGLAKRDLAPSVRCARPLARPRPAPLPRKSARLLDCNEARRCLPTPGAALHRLFETMR